MDPAEVAERTEAFVRDNFSVNDNDQGFGRDIDLFEAGYVDSVGLVELLAFLESDFSVEVPDSVLVSDEFATINGIAGAVTRLAAG